MFCSSPVRFGLVCILLLSLAGCQRHRAVERYLDAVLYRELDEKKRAVETFNEAVAIDSSFAFAYSLLGQIYEELGLYKESSLCYEKTA